LQFRAPLAPPQAAAREGATLPLSDMIALCRERIAACEKDWLLIEGAGGVMSPIADHATGLDLMAALALPSVLVAGTYLGAISHTLTALEALRVRDLAPRLVLVSDAGSDAPPVEETRALIESFAAVEALLVGADHPQGIVEAVERLRR
jgi:dethiobiotin synthetase